MRRWIRRISLPLLADLWSDLGWNPGLAATMGAVMSQKIFDVTDNGQMLEAHYSDAPSMYS